MIVVTGFAFQGYHKIGLEPSFLLQASENSQTRSVSKAWNTLHDFCTNFCPDSQSGLVDAGCLKSESVCRCDVTDFIENLVVYDSHRLQFFNLFIYYFFKLQAMNPSRGHQIGLIFGNDFTLNTYM